MCLPFKMRRGLIAPAVIPVVHSLGCALPFGFVGQASPDPLAVRVRLIPGYIDDGEIVTVQMLTRRRTASRRHTRIILRVGHLEFLDQIRAHPNIVLGFFIGAEIIVIGRTHSQSAFGNRHQFGGCE